MNIIKVQTKLLTSPKTPCDPETVSEAKKGLTNEKCSY